MLSSTTADCLRGVLSQIEAAAARYHCPVPRLVAVSKTKPVESVLEAYAAGQRHFGENYVQELVDKAPRCPADVRWHFIGQLQSNKAKALVAGVPNLWQVESVDSIKLAGKLQAAAAAAGRGAGAGGGGVGSSSGGSSGAGAASDGGAARDAPSGSSAADTALLPTARPPLRVLVQVNTSAEPQKGGVEGAAEAVELASYIHTRCPALQLAGLMTVGAAGEPPAVFFGRLVAARAAVAAALQQLSGGAFGAEALELSMGMSGDLEEAIEAGATNVRIGSAIFGARGALGGRRQSNRPGQGLVWLAAR